MFVFVASASQYQAIISITRRMCIAQTMLWQDVCLTVSVCLSVTCLYSI